METIKGHVIKQAPSVAALITLRKFSLFMAIWKVALALAARCIAVLKPSKLASLPCLELGSICEEVDLPSRVLNIVSGLGKEAGAPLTVHHDVDKELTSLATHI